MYHTSEKLEGNWQQKTLSQTVLESLISPPESLFLSLKSQLRTVCIHLDIYNSLLLGLKNKTEQNNLFYEK